MAMPKRACLEGKAGWFFNYFIVSSVFSKLLAENLTILDVIILLYSILTLVTLTNLLFQFLCYFFHMKGLIIK